MTHRPRQTSGFAVVLVGSCVLVAAASAPAAPPKPDPERTADTAAQSSAEADPEEQKAGQPKEDRYLAVTGATVHTVVGPTLIGATVLSKNGRIVGVGHDLSIPEAAERLDASGLHVYPGLVAVRSSGILGSEPPEDSTDVYGLSMTLGLSGGITTAVSGNTAAKLSFGTLEDHVLKRNLFHTLQYSTSNPDARRKFRHSLERVRQYLRELEAHEEQKKTNPDAKPPDKAWLTKEFEIARKLLQRELTAVADVNSAQDLRELAELAERYRLSLVVRGASEGWIVAPELARAGVDAVITPRIRRDPDERLNRPNGSSIENARILHEHGVTLAIIPSSTGVATWGIAGRDLMHLPMEAAFAVRGGLSDAAAIRAITIDAARILGVDHRVGSIEVGKDADFAIVDGPLLHYMTMVRWTIVNGRIAYDKQQDSLLNHIRPGSESDSPPPSDYWPRRLGEKVEAVEPEPPGNATADDE
jgi:imidazolonepropionase-like amidohydrolase